MKKLTCEMCGGTDLIKQDGLFVCQTCGAKYSAEEAKKMMTEGTDDASSDRIAADTSAELNNLYVLARRAKEANNSEQAAKYYEQILMKDPNSWEASFYTTYFSAMNCRLGQISSAAYNVEQNLKSTFELIRTSKEEDKNNLYHEVYYAVYVLGVTFINAAVSHINNNMEVESARSSGRNWISSSYSMLMAAGDYILEYANDAEAAKTVYKFIIDNNNSGSVFALTPSLRSRVEAKMKELDPDYTPAPPAVPSVGCYVATAVYGSYDCPEVWTLRRYRDYHLAETYYGRAFIHIYYAVSPIIVKWFGHAGWFKKFWKGRLDHMVASLNAKGIEDTPYEDKVW